MIDKNEPAPNLSAPIPGQAMTAPLGDRPWQKPPRFPTAEQALSFYVDRLTEDKQSEQLMDILELGVPVDTLVDTLQLGGVMEGLHSVDVGIVITPAIAELVSRMADLAEVEYTLTSVNEEDELPSKTEIALGMKHLKEKPKGIQITKDVSKEEEEDNAVQENVIEDKPRGLMSRGI